MEGLGMSEEALSIEVLPHLGVFTSVSDILPLEFCRAFQTIAIPPDLLRKCPPRGVDFWGSAIGNDILWFNRYVLGEFIRRDFSSKFPLWQLKGAQRKEAKAHAEVWSTAWKLMERLQATYGVGFSIAAPGGRTWDFKDLFAFMALYEDGQLLTPHILYREPGAGSGATLAVTAAQGVNAELFGLRNPFLPGSVSYQVVREAVRTAEMNDRFRQGYYYPMIRARMALSTYHRQTDLVAVGTGGTERRGKRAKPRVKKQAKISR
jgi:hypothetical protein